MPMGSLCECVANFILVLLLSASATAGVLGNCRTAKDKSIA